MRTKISNIEAQKANVQDNNYKANKGIGTSSQQKLKVICVKLILNKY